MLQKQSMNWIRMSFSILKQHKSFAPFSLNTCNHTLSIEYKATLEDFKAIQLHLLFIGNHAIFLTTYAISIFASTYGVTKFFIFSRASFIEKDQIHITILVFVANCTYIVGKGATLAAFIRVWENEMYWNVIWWFLFCMLPSFIFAVIVMFGSTFYTTKLCCGIPFCSNYSLRLLLEEPQIIIVPVVTPFVFRAKIRRPYVEEDSKVQDEKDPKFENPEASKTEAVQRTKFDPHFIIRPIYCIINYVITISCASAGLIYKAQLPMEIVLPIGVLILVVTLIPICICVSSGELDDVFEL